MNNKKKELDSRVKDAKKGMIVSVSRSNKWKGLRAIIFPSKKKQRKLRKR